jgi:uncharacterized protein
MSGWGRWDKVQINVSQQLKSIIGTVRDYKVDTTVDIEDNKERLTGNVRLMRVDRGILAKGYFQTRISMQCSRCLGDFIYPLDINIEEVYFPTLDLVTGTSLPSPEEPGSFTIDAHNILDLTEAIRQYTLISIPIKPLCRKNCAGLCPSCGVNLNVNKCNCLTGQIDPRWSVLKELTLTDTKYTVDN